MERRSTEVTTVVDVSLANAPVPLAVRAHSSQKTIFLSGINIYAYLYSLETAETKLHEVDFVALKGEAAVGTAAQSKPTDRKEKKQEKEEAKIEGAVQIAIGVKKEVDFAAWYTNVRICALIDVSHEIITPQRF
jgi:prolyl-tRNA synthetase